MHVIITMAGQSRRFAEAGFVGPKALLPVGESTMIEQVVDMFGAADHFHFVVSDMQVANDPGLPDRLKGLTRRADVVVIPLHEQGPSVSAIQVPGIGDDEPVIISYCDFTVTWNYSHFLRHVADCDAAVPSFRGFHPASFGKTLYAYMRVEGDRMLELREKANFTEDRTQEHASVGIYYFRAWGQFKEYAQQVIEDTERVLPEAYVSLVSAAMASDGHKVLVHEVRNFICLGTPEDYDQHQFWWDYHQHDRQPPMPQRSHPVRRINLLPMAGAGSRFREYGYMVAKPLIQVRRSPMVKRAALSMPDADKWIFLPRAEDLAKHPIAQALSSLAAECHIVPVERLTSGQAATCLLAENVLEPQAELVISSCDYECVFDNTLWHQVLEDPSIDGAVWTFRTSRILTKNPAAFAYCRTAEDGRTITEIVEKRVISHTPERDPMVVGSFWYRRAEDFVRGAKSMIERGITVNGEHYVGTSINQLLAEGKRFVIFDIWQWVSFGDPFEIKVLEYWEDYFWRISESGRNAVF